jgi:hypothetical protein
MSASASAPVVVDAVAAGPKAPKSKKPRAPKPDVAAVDASSESKKEKAPKPDAVDGSSESKKEKAPRRARFDPYVPSNFLNLQDVWAYRASQRRSLQKMKARVEASKDETERGRLMVNVRRNEGNLQQLEENLREVQGRVALLSDLVKAGVKVDVNPALSEAAQVMASSLAAKGSVAMEADD